MAASLLNSVLWQVVGVLELVCRASVFVTFVPISITMTHSEFLATRIAAIEHLNFKESLDAIRANPASQDAVRLYKAKEVSRMLFGRRWDINVRWKIK